MTMALGRYELEGRLASGGMAEIWRAAAKGPDGFSKPVVVKRILQQLGADPVVEELFKTEARIASRLDHPNLLHVFDFGREADGSLVLVMELVDGTSLRTVVRSVRKGKRLDPRIAAKLIALACEGLHAAHELKNEAGASLGLIHRDVSPENILLSRAGAVKVADFGIARVGDGPLTDPNVFRGKIGYAAPEQIMGWPIDRRTDLWAVGCTLFELIAGEGPFVADTQAELASATLHRSPRRLVEVRPQCPPRLAEIVARCLEREISERWSDAHALGAALEQFISQTGDPLRSADLGGLFEVLQIAPHTVSSQGTPEPWPALSPPPSALPTFAAVEPSTFEPIAELASDGTVHTLGPKPATAKVEPEPSSEDPRLELALATTPSPPSPQDAGTGGLTLEPLAVAVEAGPSEKAAEPEPVSRNRSVFLLPGIAIVLVGLIAVGTRFFPIAQPPGAVIIETTPSGARVHVNGEAVGQTPWAGQTDQHVKVLLLRDGYEPKTFEIDAGAEWKGVVKLQRKR